MKNTIKLIICSSLIAIGCTKKEDTAVPDAPLTAGTANFSKYVAVGNSLTAGFSDGALFKEGQLGSWTNVLNEQFKLVGGGEFKIPFMPDNNIGGIINPMPACGINFIQNPRLYWNGAGVSPAGAPTSQVTDKAVGSGFNNMGVPGAKIFHLLAAGYGNVANLPNANPYFCRFASTANARIIDDATAQNATFFSCWIGNNDVLSYATSGGEGVDQKNNFNAATYGTNDITSPTVFAGAYNAIINGTTSPVVAKGLTSDGAKGVVCNIPYVTSIPFFTTVKYNAATLNDAQVTALNSGYAAYNGGLQAAKNAGLITEAERVARKITFAVGPNALVMVDNDLTTVNVPGVITLPNYRQTTAEDFILLSSTVPSTTPPCPPVSKGAQAHLAAGNGTQFPLATNWVLSKIEVGKIKTATDAYNVTIKSIATAKGLAFVDTNSILSQVANGGISANGYTITSAYPTGGAFSLDGVHPCARGYALIANKVMEAINATYGSNLRPVDVTKYRVQYPRTF